MSKENSKQKSSIKNTPEQDKSQEVLSVQTLKDVFGEALSEDVKEIEEFSTKEPELKSSPKRAKSRRAMKRRLYMSVGLFVIIMSIVGIFSTVSFTMDVAKRIADNTGLKNEFAQFIYPLVVIDPPDFDATVDLPNSTMITASIWNIILNEDKEKYTTEMGMMYVPYLDVEASATYLFGSGLAFEHETVGDIELAFIYDEETKSYIVPTSPKYLPYSPRIESFKRVGETYTLLVGYMPPGHSWLNDLKEDRMPEAEKHMEYVVTRRKNQMKVVKVKFLPKEEKIDLKSK